MAQRQAGFERRWGSAQATVLSLKALLAGSHVAAARDKEASIEAFYPSSGKEGDGGGNVRVTVSPQQSAVVQTVRLAGLDQAGTHKVRLQAVAAAGMAYQLVVSYHSLRENPDARPGLAVSVKYDRTQLETGDSVKVHAVVTNNASTPARMLMVDVGIAAGVRRPSRGPGPPQVQGRHRTLHAHRARSDYLPEQPPGRAGPEPQLSHRGPHAAAR